jgi:PucR C-terminal helix-turn-helix domain
MLAQLYEGRADEVADDLVSQLVTIFPLGEELGDAFRRDVIEKSRGTLARVVKLLGTGESFEVLGPVIEEVARTRRRQRVSQEIIFAGYRYLQHLLFERVTNEVQDLPQSRRLIDALALRQLEFQWIVSRRVAAAFDSTVDTVAASRRTASQALLEALLGHREGPNGLPEFTTRFGLLLPLDHIAVSQSATHAVILAANEAALRMAVRANPWSVVGELDGRVIVISRGAPAGMPAHWGGCRFAPETLERSHLLAASLAQADQAAQVATRLGLPCADADEVAPFIAVSGLPPHRQEAFLQSCFGDLHRSARGAPIMQAVAMSARSTGRKEAALRLKVHPNTLDYRLARFRELTQFDLADPIQRLRCDLGLYLLGLLGD